MTTDKPTGPVSFGGVAAGLVALAAGLVAMLVITMRAASSMADPAAKKLLVRLAWLSLVLLSLNLLMLLWCILRYIRYRIHMQPPIKPSTYVNAWELAGKRFQLEDEGDPDEDETGGSSVG